MAEAPLEGRTLLTKSTNVLFRCPEFNTLHDKGEVYRYVLVSPQGVWATMVAIDGRATGVLGIAAPERM